MAVFEPIAFVLAGIMIIAAIYYLGSLMGIWERFRTIHGGSTPPKLHVPSKLHRTGGGHDDLPADYDIGYELWMEARIRQHDVWYYAARHSLMLRIHIATVDKRETLYIETLTYEEFAARIGAPTRLVALYVLTTNSGQVATTRQVNVDCIQKGHEYQLLPAYEQPEGEAVPVRGKGVLETLKDALAQSDLFDKDPGNA